MKINCIFFTIVVIFGCLLQNFQASPISESSSSFVFPVDSDDGDSFVFPEDSDFGENFVFPEDSDNEDADFAFPETSDSGELEISYRGVSTPKCQPNGGSCNNSDECCNKQCLFYAHKCVS